MVSSGRLELGDGSDGIESGGKRDGQAAVVLHEWAGERWVRLHRGAQAFCRVLDPVVTIGVPALVPTVEGLPSPPADIEHGRVTVWVGQRASLAPQLP